MALALVACNDEMDEMVVNGGNNAPAQMEGRSELADDVKVYPLLYSNFKSANDVVIASADTTSMVVKSALLDAMRVRLEPGNVISVWTSADEIPFMRRVEDVTKDGSDYRLRTCTVGLDEVLKEAHLEFDSKVYVNADEDPRNADGTINDRFYQSERDGVYHPTALWFHTKHEDARLRGKSLTRGAADDDVLKLGYDRERTVIVEDMRLTRAACNLGVSFSAEVEDLTCPIIEDGDTIASIGLQKAEFNFDGGLHARLDCSFWNGIERFEVGPYYSIEGNLKAGVSMSSDLFDLKKEYTIAECQGFTSCFWVGPVPVVVSFTPSLVFNAELKGSAEGAIGAEVSFKGSHHTYACYDHNRDWYLDEGGEDFTYDVTPYAGGRLGLEFQTGLYAKAAVSLYGVAGPTVAAGPYFKAEAEAAVDLVEADFKANVKASVGLGGTVGAELKIWHWNLAKWEVGFNLLEKEIFNESFNFDEWKEQMEAAKQIIPTGNNIDWEAAMAEAEKAQRYKDDLDNIIGDNAKALQRFMQYMSPEFDIQTADDWFRDHSDVIADWQTIKEQHLTFYNWDLEFALWKYDVLHNSEMVIQICEQIDKDAQAKMEALANALPAKVRKAFDESVITGRLTIEEALAEGKIPVVQALVDDWQNIRIERQKHLDYGNKTHTYPQEANRDYFTDWYEAFGRK